MLRECAHKVHCSSSRLQNTMQHKPYQSTLFIWLCTTGNKISVEQIPACYWHAFLTHTDTHVTHTQTHTHTHALTHMDTHAHVHTHTPTHTHTHTHQNTPRPNTYSATALRTNLPDYLYHTISPSPTGTLPFKPSSAWPYLFSHAKEVYSLRCQLRGSPQASQLLDRWGWWLRKRSQCSGEPHTLLSGEPWPRWDGRPLPRRQLHGAKQEQLHDAIPYLASHYQQAHQHPTILLVVGHTKFAPDWCFGLFKCRYRRTTVSSLRSIAQVVNDSAECNISQLVAREDGSMIVPTHNWTDFFAPRMKKITGIKTYHHFRMSSSAPGCVFVKEHSDSSEVKIDLLKEPWNPSADELPEVVPPKGLSAERQWYLHEQIRPFCSEEDRDTVCPLPAVPKPGSRQGTPALENADEVTPPPSKRRRVCGLCKREGHDRWSWPQK